MSKTPKKRRVSVAGVDSPAALKGKRIECPGPIFHESPEKVYAGVIFGTPRSRKNAVNVRFDEDGTEYWFPVEQVKEWIVDDGNSPAKALKQMRTKRKAEAEVERNAQEVPRSAPACTSQKRSSGEADADLASPSELRQDAETARIDAIYRAQGWHSFQQFLIFWGLLMMGILAGILIWLVRQPQKK